MSALRQLLGALWAAVWLRGRLLGPRLRRLVGGRRPSADDRPDFYLAASDVPVEGVDYELVELPAELAARLDATRVALLDRARSESGRQIAPRGARRDRSIAVAIAVLLGLGVVGAGASALVAGSTGIPSVDRLLGIYEVGLSDLEAPPGAGHGVRPAQGTTSVSVEAPLGDSGRKAIGAGYVGQDGGICIARADALPSGRPVGGLRCVQPEELGARIAEFGGQWGVAVDEKVVLLGVTRGDVAELQGYGPDGPLKTYLSEAWNPDLPGIGVLRLFLAVDSVDLGGPLPRGEIDRFLEFDRYEMRGKLEDGESIVITRKGDAG